MKIILIFVLIFSFNQANSKKNNYLKAIKPKDYRNRVYDSKYNQGIWFRIGKRSNSHDLKLHFDNGQADLENSHESDLPAYIKSLNFKGLKEKLEASMNHEKNQSIGIKYFKKIIEPSKQMRQKNIKNKSKPKNGILNRIIG
jgi:hypothetical protein